MKRFLVLLALVAGCGAAPTPPAADTPTPYPTPFERLERDCAPGAYFGITRETRGGDLVSWDVLVTWDTPGTDPVVIGLRHVLPNGTEDSAKTDLVPAGVDGAHRLTLEPSAAGATGGSVVCPDVGTLHFVAEYHVEGID